ncbi:DUF871 domain-containing protein [Paramaledivibacter caminithermalis]|jgi:hypothetical protein|uniref:Outer surface protein n=1 Tax=Paramaledivibacter caminithermalis (strain DSM 15212 / CIP 107654 / DViRD3) TaxID=1121301 RepID=A0A1M6PGW1_PARC5|nr:MupG family TIM beta-alpha barrel fold protein [Paramaledivibacter caminithermalis]SHK07196.1 hypothetical protein SAMN02745912_02152 [Paramaledivibacter caminithermalis DSM 15212]
MKRLGVSIYPENASVEENKAYLSLAAKYGFTRVFTCLISVDGDVDRIIKEFKEIVTHAKNLGMEVIADVSPEVFKRFNISYKDSVFFHELNLTGIRLDLGFSGFEESFMTFNSHNLKIELNMSNGTKYLDNILSYIPKKENLIGCHNFYPHRYTGLSRKHFLKCSEQFKEYGIRTAAFVSSSNATFGPWPVSEGLCTLEEHRNKCIEVQTKDLFNTGLIDDVIIANCFASEEELKVLGKLDKDILTLGVELVENIPEIERKIVLDELHFNRGDVSEYMIRSTQSRVKYKGNHFELFNPKPIKRGDILIESSLYNRYAGEFQIALKDMDNSGKTNVVGKIADEELFLIDYIEPWQKFKLELKNKRGEIKCEL